MHAADIMTRPVVTTSPDAHVTDAVVLLTEGGFAGLPVVNEDDQVVGIFTEADALRNGNGSGQGAAARVRDVMTTPVEVVRPVTEVADIARLMLRDGMRCLPVVDEGVLVGVVSRRDVLRPFVRPDDALATHVRKVLDDYDGHRDRWRVDVTGGIATVSGVFADEAERRIVGALVRTVPGVLRADLQPL
ncbi:CBS domain-containing protein [Prauserella muralis]|uniref:Signal transduction protein n=1 Tax=Prauserella muralis TaxID=588067 RepID=A0A2V4AQT4_9PSEU|nr:CBS domain-containing protein [Prauserella muralis]PXY22913.1 signal transduction protein [Prauserella muralis]